MQKPKLNFVFKFLIYVVIIGILTGGIDYLRIKSNQLPLFAIRSYDAKTKTQTFRGFFYKTTRIISISQDEDISASKDIQYLVLTFKIPINVPRETPINEFTIETVETKECSNPSQLYYYDDTNFKIYTYCLDTINIVKDDKKTSLDKYILKDKDVVVKLLNKLYVTREFSNSLTLQYEDKPSMKFTNNGLSVISCKTSTGNNNIYIGPKNMLYQSDFCTDKEDIPPAEPTSPEPQQDSSSTDTDSSFTDSGTNTPQADTVKEPINGVTPNE